MVVKWEGVVDERSPLSDVEKFVVTEPVFLGLSVIEQVGSMISFS